MRDSSDETEELDTTYWQKTYEKQRRVQLRRDERVKNETADGAKILRDIFKTDTSPSYTASTRHSVSPQGKTILSARYTSIPPAPPTSEGSGLEVPQVSTTASPAVKPRGNQGGNNYCATSRYFSTEDGDAQSSLCNSMLSLSVSSNPSNSVPSSSSTTPGRGKKYYVVSVGKCTGVFNNWPYVQSLTSGVTGGCQKSYPTYNEALSVYREIKGKGLVQIIRDPGDEIFFGSIEDAMQ